MWTAENPSSTASGGFQWLDGSWTVNLGRAGLSGPHHAAFASPVVQAEVTAWVITHKGQRNWNGSHCGYGT
jgi:muramidase (phage lysozyme)